jgi:hypothetical protein
MPSLALQTGLVDSLNALQGRHGEIDERTDGRPQEFRRGIDQEELRRFNLIFWQHSNQCAGFQFVRDEKNLRCPHTFACLQRVDENLRIIRDQLGTN